MSNTAKFIVWAVWSVISPIGVSILTDRLVNRYINRTFKAENEKEIQIEVEED